MENAIFEVISKKPGNMAPVEVVEMEWIGYVDDDDTNDDDAGYGYFENGEYDLDLYYDPFIGIMNFWWWIYGYICYGPSFDPTINPTPDPTKRPIKDPSIDPDGEYKGCRIGGYDEGNGGVL